MFFAFILQAGIVSAFTASFNMRQPSIEEEVTSLLLMFPPHASAEVAPVTQVVGTAPSLIHTTA